jgi:hypothetical protein
MTEMRPQHFGCLPTLQPLPVAVHSSAGSAADTNGSSAAGPDSSNGTTMAVVRGGFELPSALLLASHSLLLFACPGAICSAYGCAVSR